MPIFKIFGANGKYLKSLLNQNERLQRSLRPTEGRLGDSLNPAGRAPPRLAPDLSPIPSLGSRTCSQSPWPAKSRQPTQMHPITSLKCQTIKSVESPKATSDAQSAQPDLRSNNDRLDDNGSPLTERLGISQTPSKLDKIGSPKSDAKPMKQIPEMKKVNIAFEDEVEVQAESCTSEGIKEDQTPQLDDLSKIGLQKLHIPTSSQIEPILGAISNANEQNDAIKQEQQDSLLESTPIKRARVGSMEVNQNQNSQRIREDTKRNGLPLPGMVEALQASSIKNSAKGNNGGIEVGNQPGKSKTSLRELNLDPNEDDDFGMLKIRRKMSVDVEGSSTKKKTKNSIDHLSSYSKSIKNRRGRDTTRKKALSSTRKRVQFYNDNKNHFSKRGSDGNLSIRNDANDYQKIGDQKESRNPMNNQKLISQIQMQESIYPQPDLAHHQQPQNLDSPPQREKKAFVVEVDDIYDVDIIKNLIDDPRQSHNLKVGSSSLTGGISNEEQSSDIVMLNTSNNLIDQNFNYFSEKVADQEDQDMLLRKHDDIGNIQKEWSNYHFHYKVIRLDLYENEAESNDYNAQKTPNMVRLYQVAYRQLKHDLRKKRLAPCIVNNLSHSIHVNKEGDIAYIIFQMTIVQSRQDKRGSIDKDSSTSKLQNLNRIFSKEEKLLAKFQEALEEKAEEARKGTSQKTVELDHVDSASSDNSEKNGEADSRSIHSEQPDPSAFKTPSKYQNVAMDQFSDDNSVSSDLHSRSVSKRAKSKKCRCVNLFGLFKPTPYAENERPSPVGTMLGEMGQSKAVKILSFSENIFQAASANMHFEVMRYLGIVDVTIYRRFAIDTLESSPSNNKKISNIIEKAIEEVNEIMRSKVAAIKGNCIQGYKIEINRIREKDNLMGPNAFNLSFSAIGDAVELGIYSNEPQINPDDGEINDLS